MDLICLVYLVILAQIAFRFWVDYSMPFADVLIVRPDLIVGLQTLPAHCIAGLAVLKQVHDVAAEITHAQTSTPL